MASVDKENMPAAAKSSKAVAKPARQIVYFGEKEETFYKVSENDGERRALLEAMKADCLCPKKWLALLTNAPLGEATDLDWNVKMYQRAWNILQDCTTKQTSEDYMNICLELAHLQTDGDPRSAKQTFRQMQRMPLLLKNPRFYALFAQLEQTQGNKLMATQILKDGLKRIPDDATLLELLKECASNNKGGVVAQLVGQKENAVVKPSAKQRFKPRLLGKAGRLGAAPTRVVASAVQAAPLTAKPSAVTPKAEVPGTLKMKTISESLSPVLESPTSGSDDSAQDDGSASTKKATAAKVTSADLSYMKAWKPRNFKSSNDDDTVVFSHKTKVTAKQEQAANDDETVVLGKVVGTSNVDMDDKTEKLETEDETMEVEMDLDDQTVQLNANGKSDDKTENMTEKMPLEDMDDTDEDETMDDSTVVLNTKPSADEGNGDQTVSFGQPSQSRVSPTPPEQGSPSLATGVFHSSFTFIDRKNIITVNGTPYLKLTVIGRGGSSKVFKVMGTDNEVYALKRIKLNTTDEREVTNYRNEIKLLESLRGSKYIVNIVDSEVNLRKKEILVVMEKGEIDLNQMLQQLWEKGEKPNENFLRLTWEHMLEAVHSVHEKRIVHGDLKPANFLFVNGKLKLIDFGIAKTISNDTTNIMRDSQVGTLNYMSPEAILDTSQMKDMGYGSGSSSSNDEPCLKLGRASDIWSLGCILYQMVYGKTPFAHLNVIQKLQQIVNPALPIKFPEHENGALVESMKCCLERDPRTRATIPGLLAHSFLHPRDTLLKSAPADALGEGMVGCTSEQIQSIIEHALCIARKRGIESVPAENVAKEVFAQLKAGTGGNPIVQTHEKVEEQHQKQQLARQTQAQKEQQLEGKQLEEAARKPSRGALSQMNLKDQLKQRKEKLQSAAESNSDKYMKEKSVQEANDLRSVLVSGFEKRWKNVPQSENTTHGFTSEWLN
jgi:tRNA A-37 threonylcarbamoyl transferase component Bud32